MFYTLCALYIYIHAIKLNAPGKMYGNQPNERATPNLIKGILF